MPKTTEEKVKKKKNTAKTAVKKSTSKAKVVTSKNSTGAKKVSTAKKISNSSKTKNANKKAPTKKVEPKKVVTKKTTTNKSTPKKTTNKKLETRKEAAKKNVAKSKSTTKKAENKKLKKDTKNKASKTKTATNKSAVAPKNTVSNEKTTKRIAPKKTTANKNVVPKKDVASKERDTKEIVPKKTEAKNEEKINEKTVIEKIKAFIAKIIAMQEEARLEEENEGQEKATKKSKVKAKKEIEAKPSYILEYYDLPYRYNETVVKILAQTPKRLFVYWDISDKDRQKYLMAFGEKFFEETYPVLLVHNEDMNYTFEVPINDFANSWYLDINDSKANYIIQLGRKFRNQPTQVNIVAATETESVQLYNDYVPIVTSNMLEVPNDHILFEKIQSKVLYRNVKTGEESTVDIDNLEFSKRIGHIYSIYDVYKEIYKNELDDKTLTDLLNPSSMSSSVFK